MSAMLAEALWIAGRFIKARENHGPGFASRKWRISGDQPITGRLPVPGKPDMLEHVLPCD